MNAFRVQILSVSQLVWSLNPVCVTMGLEFKSSLGHSLPIQLPPPFAHAMVAGALWTSFHLHRKGLNCDHCIHIQFVKVNFPHSYKLDTNTMITNYYGRRRHVNLINDMTKRKGIST